MSVCPACHALSACLVVLEAVGESPPLGGQIQARNWQTHGRPMESKTHGRPMEDQYVAIGPSKTSVAAR